LPEPDDAKYKFDNLLSTVTINKKLYFSGFLQFPDMVIENYGQLWHIEKAFRISKTDLRIRPMYHRWRRRIEAHILVAFVAYTIYKELERRLSEADISISPRRTAELTQNMYEVSFKLPTDPQLQRILLQMDDEQRQLYKLLY
jgi:transposase